MIGINIWLYTVVPILVLMIAIWIISLILKNASIVEIFWGLGFVIVFWFTYMRTPLNHQLKTTLLGVIVTVWGFRLAVHILLRSIGEGEDARYVQFRVNNGANWWWSSLFKVFILQGLLIWIVSAPFSIMQALSSDIGPVTIFGFCIWLLDFVFEALADLQLARFKSNPNNKGLLTSGLWSLSRHPNNFGDATQWWGFWLIALSPATWWTIFSPVLMTFSLLKFSGLPITAKMLRRDNLGYQNYVKTVPQFIPSFSRIIRNNK